MQLWGKSEIARLEICASCHYNVFVWGIVEYWDQPGQAFVLVTIHCKHELSLQAPNPKVEQGSLKQENDIITYWRSTN